MSLINLVGNTLGVIMKKLDEREENWVKSLCEYKSKSIEELSIQNMTEEGFIFENQLGITMTFHVQSMSGEKSPKEGYGTFIIEPELPIFISKSEFLYIRKCQANQLFGQSTKLITEDILRIMIQISGWKYASDIPIELGGCHSFIVKYGKKTTKENYYKYSLPIVCRVSHNV